MDAHYLTTVIILLVSAIALVSISARLRFGPILGYMAAGLVIGPAVLGIVERNEITEALAELGVVFLLFSIGLELPVSRLKTIGTRVFLLGLLQIVITAALVAMVAYALTGSRSASLAIGCALALSSTAIVARHLTDNRMHNSRTGRTAIAVLLIQDLALGPLLVFVLALGERAQTDLTFTMFVTLIKGVIAVALIWIVGRFVLERLFSALVATRIPDLFSGIILLTLLLTSAVTHMAELSLGFGGFLAGMLLADTQYRHQIAADIRPYRGLLLGLFFITIGMRIELDPTWVAIASVVATACALIAAKTAIIAVLARFSGLEWHRAWHTGLLLSQGGEFAFVILGKSAETGLVSPFVNQTVLLATILTMALTPLLAWLGGKVESRMPDPEEPVTPLSEIQEEQDLTGHVIIAGFGRVGQQVASELDRQKIPWVAVDTDVPGVRSARRAGKPVHYADITHPEVLEALKLDEAQGLVIAFNDGEQALVAASLVHYIFPDVRITARAHDEAQADRIKQAGATVAIPEVLDTGRHLLAPILGQASPDSFTQPVSDTKAVNI